MHKEEFQKIVRNLCLETIDAEGGHIYIHKNKDDSELMKRAKAESIFGASSFTCDAETLVECIRKALYNYEADLLDWLQDNSDGDDYSAECLFEEPIGKGYYNAKWHEWSKGAVQCKRIVVVLRKVERTYDTTFSIVTAYCEPSEEDMKG